MIVESSSRTSAMPVGRRVERLLEAPAGLLQGPDAVLALGDVAQPDDHAAVGLRGGGRRSPRPASPSPPACEQAEAPSAGPAARDGRRPATTSSSSRRRLDEVGERPARRGRRRAAGELGGLGVGAAHDAVVVERHHRLGQVVEQQAQLGLGVDQPIDRAVEVAGDAPRLEPGDDDRGGGQQAATTAAATSVPASGRRRGG